MNVQELRAIKQRYSIIGTSDGLNRALDIAVQVAPTDLSVLIQGESGVGKEVVPRIIHEKSKRKHQKYLAINCGSIPEGTIDSELFGHEEGAFTGSVGQREGYFGAANKGTLFLDEVGELPLSTQARLLRVLETGEYFRVGSSEVRKTDVRIIAATNVNLHKAMSEGKFREDLYYRLATIPINMPPLRERGKDIVLLFRKFITDFCETYHRDTITLTEEAKTLLQCYKWPGNVRQMKNICDQVCLMNGDGEITAQELMDAGVTNDSGAGTGLVVAKAQQTGQHSYESERELLFRALTNLGKEVKELKELIGQQGRTEKSAAQGTSSQIYTATPESTYPIQIGIPVETQSEDYPSEVTEAEEYVEETTTSNRELVKEHVLEVLQKNKGSRAMTAKQLGISIRTLYRKLKQYENEDEKQE